MSNSHSRGEGAGAPGAFRELLDSGRPVRLAGAHSPLGALIAEEAGFDGIWSSGLEISASRGVPDMDILSMSDLLAVARSMASAVRIPVTADCDAGYGGVANVMHTVREHEAAGIAAVCIEDKVFPKRNSFADVEQHLLPVDEFCAKIDGAVRARRRCDGLVVIARTEALITGGTVRDALARAGAYADAGADAVLVHAKGASPAPVVEFLRAWRRRTPAVVVPTTYHTIRADELHAAGADVIIYANHGLRAQVAALRRVFAQILDDRRTTGIEDDIASVADVFDLQRLYEALDDEALSLKRARATLARPRVAAAR